MVHNAGTGLLSSPLGIVMRPGALRTPPRAVSVDLDGSGLLSSPLGVVPAETVDLGGGALVSFDGTDLWSGVLGLHPTHLFGSQGPAGSGLLSSPLGFTGDAIDLGDASSDADLSGTHLGGWVSRGGFRLGSGEEAGNHLIGSGAVSLRAGLIEGSGAGSQSGTL